MADDKIVAAVGSATATAKRGNPIEELMAQEVLKASAEAEEIWKSDIPIEEKNNKIAAIMSDDAIRARKLKARADYRAEQFRRSHENSAAAQIEALKNLARGL